MDRINHVKVVTPEPELVEAFLREVCDIPEGWPLGDAERVPPDAPLGPGGELTQDDVVQRRNAGDGVVSARGFIAGSPESRQFQIFASDTPAKGWRGLQPATAPTGTSATTSETSFASSEDSCSRSSGWSRRAPRAG